MLTLYMFVIKESKIVYLCLAVNYKLHILPSLCVFWRKFIGILYKESKQQIYVL